MVVGVPAVVLLPFLLNNPKDPFGICSGSSRCCGGVPPEGAAGVASGGTESVGFGPKRITVDGGSFTDKSEGTQFVSGEGCEKETRRMNPEGGGAGAAAILARLTPTTTSAPPTRGTHPSVSVRHLSCSFTCI